MEWSPRHTRGDHFTASVAFSAIRAPLHISWPPVLQPPSMPLACTLIVEYLPPLAGFGMPYCLPP